MAPRSTVSTPAARAGTAASARPLSPAASVVGGEMVIGDEVAEPRGVAVEGELPRADRAVALLGDDHLGFAIGALRSEEHTSELQSLMRISYAVFCLKKKKK